MVIVLIASNIDSYERFEHLSQTLESLNKKEIEKIIISMSFCENLCENIDIKNVMSKYSNILLTCQMNKMYQFEHYNFIYVNYFKENIQNNIDINKRVMFINDDDMLIDIPEEFKTDKIILGYQHPVDTSSNFSELMELKDIDDKNIIDFSGYSCLIKDLKE